MTVDYKTDIRRDDIMAATQPTGQMMTWESECRHTLRFLNPDGDLGICVLWNLLESVMEQLPEDAAGSRLYAVGNSRTPIGISWLLRGLLLNPQVRTLAIWGADLTKTGEALLQLWAEGPTPDHRVPVFNWKLDALISPELIDRLRSEVRLVDGRGRKLPEVVAELENLPAPAPVQREPIELPPVVVPDRVTLPSRGSTVTVHAPDVGEGWLQAINAVLRLGEVRRSRKKETIAHTFHVTVELRVPAEPIAVPECFDVTPADFETYFE
ncbi:MAG: hypothetical protein HY329_02670, partial [Chloroflexi bacterium]|nr:hypothetical protein [Chloroflexota bacterium]